MQVGGADFELIVMTDTDTLRDRLEMEVHAIEQIFIDRDAEFGHSDHIIDEYPWIRDSKTSCFLLDPAGYIARRTAEVEIEQQVRVGRIIVFTTNGQCLLEPLSNAGYASDQIDMPAWSARLHTFTLNLGLSRDPDVTLFFDAVDYAIGKQRPTFVIKLLDSGGKLCGGASGSVHERGKQRFAYIATFTLKAGLPRTTGTRLAEAMISFFRHQGVNSVDLITQTAGVFYEKLGFQITHCVVEGIRTRVESDGQFRSEDLMILNIRLFC